MKSYAYRYKLADGTGIYITSVADIATAKQALRNRYMDRLISIRRAYQRIGETIIHSQEKLK